MWTHGIKLKTGHPVYHHKQLLQVPVLGADGTWTARLQMFKSGESCFGKNCTVLIITVTLTFILWSDGLFDFVLFFKVAVVML